MYYVGTFDQYNIREMLGERVLIPYMLQNKLKKLLVILEYFSSKRIEFKKIAGGLTGLVQLGDTIWFSPMKR
jgi:hypothetical protein